MAGALRMATGFSRSPLERSTRSARPLNKIVVERCGYIPKYHWLPFLVWCISGSRSFFLFLFLVELGAAIKVASMIVSCFMVIPLALR